ncbi:MAG TPA: hypothetical protein VNB49_11470 [Candidatus Dormibacteraeota bacterium]|nr:hypothetical protein [Candidatus Dormibacteraeota bacterium]
MKLPKIGPAKTKNLFEEYFYILLAVVFFAVTILGKAGGFSTYNAVIVGAWVTAILWAAGQWRGYLTEKAKAQNGKTSTPPSAAPAEAPKGPPKLPPGMKPMIGPQWPLKPRARPAWPGLPKQPAAEAQTRDSKSPNVPTPNVQAPSLETQEPDSGGKKVFVYERPTLPDRKPKLPNNWANPTDRKADNKNLSNKKPKR